MLNWHFWFDGAEFFLNYSYENKNLIISSAYKLENLQLITGKSLWYAPVLVFSSFQRFVDNYI